MKIKCRYVHVGNLELAAPRRKAGLREAYQKAGKLVVVNGKPFLQLTEQNYQQIRRDYPPIETVVARKLAEMRKTIPKPAAVGLAAPKQSEGGSTQSATSTKSSPLLSNLGILKIARNAAGAAGRTIVAATKGQKLFVSDTQNEARLDICGQCDKLVNKEQSRENWKCARCGCQLAGKVLAKARLVKENCPEGKWPTL